MFTENEIAKALSWLFDLFLPEDYSAYEKQEICDYEGIHLQELCIVFQEDATAVYESHTMGSYRGKWAYFGKELFNQRAYLLCREEKQNKSGVVTAAFDTELWILEDMSFALTRCIYTAVALEKDHYETVYRQLVKKVDRREDLFCSPDDLLKKMKELCAPEWEETATIFE